MHATVVVVGLVLAAGLAWLFTLSLGVAIGIRSALHAIDAWAVEREMEDDHEC